MSPDYQAALTLCIAVLGAVLGLINLWRALGRDRVRLRVTPESWLHSHGGNGLAIEVINLGWVPVTVTQVGFTVRGRKQLLSLNITVGGSQFTPQRLEARAAFTAHFPAGCEHHESFHLVTRAFAKTACGLRFRGTNKALRHYVQAARAAQQRAAQ